MADWVDLGTEVMRQARHSLGLSYESFSRLIPVSSKTYERWEKAGRVPRHSLARVAELLGLEIEQPARRRVTVATEDPGVAAETAAIVSELRRLGRRVSGLQDAVRRLEERLPPSEAEPASDGQG